MRFQRLIGLSSLSALAYAQYNGLPDCAKSCVGDSIAKSGCDKIQVGCICEDAPLIASLACCVGKSCTNTQDIKDTQTFASQICAPYSVTLPAAATCASSTAASSSSKSSGASGSSTTPSSSSATTTASSSSGTAAAASTAPASGSSGSTGAAPIQTIGVGLGAAAAGLLVVL